MSSANAVGASTWGRWPTPGITWTFGYPFPRRAANEVIDRIDFVHASRGVQVVDSGIVGPSGTPDVSFYCEDIKNSVAEMKALGVEFTGPVEDRGYGFVTHFKVPGGFAIQLYQPKYAK